jgi:hypothetical protein
LENLDGDNDVDIKMAWESIRENMKASVTSILILRMHSVVWWVDINDSDNRAASMFRVVTMSWFDEEWQ